jgi:Sec7-like guanine-nucleotide exchange factor
LLSVVTKTEVASVLASSADEFHTIALGEYKRRFSFVHDPLLALKKLLMDIRLLRETQIDRVMEAFAKRYNECNEGIWSQEGECLVYWSSVRRICG